MHKHRDTPTYNSDKEAYKSSGIKPRPKPGFDDEYRGKNVKITLSNGATIIGVAETSQYWIKVKAHSGIIYVNKAHVVLIEPLE